MLKWIVIGMYALKIVFDAFVDHLRDVAAGQELPESVRDVYDETEYKRWQEYHTDKRRLSTIKTVVFAIINIVLLAANVYSLVFNLLPGGTFVKYVLFGLIFEAFTNIVYLPFEYYATFTIEAKYDMNKTTGKTFFSDSIKNFILNFLVMCFLMFLIMIAFSKLGNWGIAVACGGVALFIIAMQMSSGLFLKLFNKFTPLEEGTLREKLTDLCDKYGTTVRDISVMDMSRRTTKANAFCSGLGKAKKIALADNLVERYSEDRIVAVFAHEFGHAKYGHMPKMIIGNILRISVSICIFGIILNIPQLFTAFGFEEVNYYFLLTLETISWPIGEAVELILNYFARRCEYEADAMAAKEGYGEDIIASLKQLSREALSDINPHPVVIALEHDHPSLPQRIEAIRKITGK